MIDELLVPLDGSDLSLRALPVAGAIASRIGATVTAVSIVDPRLDAYADEVWLEENAVLGDVDVQRLLIPSDDAASTLLDLAASRPGAGICMTSHGRTGIIRRVLGSVSAEVVRRSVRPVLLVGPHAVPPSQFDAVGVRSDDRRAVDVGREWARALRTSHRPPAADALLVTTDDQAAELVRTATQPVLVVGPNVPVSVTTG